METDQKTNILIVGAGEVGAALGAVLKQYSPEFLDIKKGLKPTEQQYEYLHICFPYSEDFIEQVKTYQNIYHPTYTIIHSTVPVGTSTKLGALHSPIRGIHPNLHSGIQTFIKFIGGPQASFVADHFRRAGLKVMLFDKPETTEAMKLFDTEYYRACIEFCQRVKKYCDESGLNFHEVYTLANITYNEGYTKLDHPEFVRPILQPIMKPIGGHCVAQNQKLIEKTEK